VVETSFRSLNKGNGGSGEPPAPEVLCIDSLNKAVPKSSTRQRSLRTLAEHFMAQLPSLQEPCVVKVAFKGRYQYEFD
jgi:hypothetical protein